jgi:hypothetical protein
VEAIFKFNLDDADDANRHRRMLAADATLHALWNMGDALRSAAKYGDSDTVDIHEVRKKFYEILTDAGVDLDLLWS